MDFDFQNINENLSKAYMVDLNNKLLLRIYKILGVLTNDLLNVFLARRSN